MLSLWEPQPVAQGRQLVVLPLWLLCQDFGFGKERRCSCSCSSCTRCSSGSVPALPCPHAVGPVVAPHALRAGAARREGSAAVVGSTPRVGLTQAVAAGHSLTEEAPWAFRRSSPSAGRGRLVVACGEGRAWLVEGPLPAEAAVAPQAAAAAGRGKAGAGRVVVWPRVGGGLEAASDPGAEGDEAVGPCVVVDPPLLLLDPPHLALANLQVVLRQDPPLAPRPDPADLQNSAAGDL